MKTVLWATSALVAFAGAAAAEITFDGDARIGLRYDDSSLAAVFDDDGDFVSFADSDDEGWNVVSRARIRFTMTGETDSGLSFGARFRANEVDRISGGSNFSNTDGEVWIEGAYGKLTAGDIDSAMESAVGDLLMSSDGIGVSGLNYYNEFTYTTSEFDTESDFDNAGLIYEYKWGDVSLYASFMDQFVGNTTEDIEGDAWSVGAGYTLGNYTFGIGYEEANLYLDPIVYTALSQDFSVASETSEAIFAGSVLPNDNSSWGISGGTSWAGIGFKAIYVSTSVDGEEGTILADDYDVQQFGIGAEYEMANGIGIGAFYRKNEGDDILGEAHELEAYGIGATYDLGGGAELRGGIAHINGTSAVFDDPTDPDYDGDFDRTVADFGLRMTF